MASSKVSKIISLEKILSNYLKFIYLRTFKERNNLKFSVKNILLIYFKFCYEFNPFWQTERFSIYKLVLLRFDEYF